MGTARISPTELLPPAPRARRIAAPAPPAPDRDAALQLPAPDRDAALRDGDLRERAAALFDAVSAGVVVQRAGRIVYANPAMAELAGRATSDALVGLSSLETYCEDDLPAVLERLQSASFGRPARASRHHLPRPDGACIAVEVTCLALPLGPMPMLIEVVRPVGPNGGDLSPRRGG